jgi:hypothetical protein
VPAPHHEMSIASYALLAVLAISHEFLGLAVALTLGLGLAGMWILGSLLISVLHHWRAGRPAAAGPEGPAQSGGARLAAQR